MILRTELGAILKEAREAKGLSKAEVHRRLFPDRQNIKKAGNVYTYYERQGVNNIERAAAAFDVMGYELVVSYRPKPSPFITEETTLDEHPTTD